MYAIVKPAAKEDAADEKPAAKRVTIENGEPTITLDAETQEKIALTTSKTTVSQQSEELAQGSAVPQHDPVESSP